MISFNVMLPAVSCLISLIFAVFVLARFFKKKGLHQLFWGIGMLFYSAGGMCEAYNAIFGWNSLVFRLWYLFGAILVAAWLGQGTVYLLAKPKVAHSLLVILILASLYAAYRIATAQLDPALSINPNELNGQVITSPGVRTLTPFFNIYGTLTLVGGSIWSIWIFFRKRVLLHRVIGNIFIAAGALFPAFGGSFSRFGISGALYWSELLGAALMFIGFLRATTPMKNEAPVRAPELAN